MSIKYECESIMRDVQSIQKKYDNKIKEYENKIQKLTNCSGFKIQEIKSIEFLKYSQFSFKNYYKWPSAAEAKLEKSYAEALEIEKENIKASEINKQIYTTVFNMMDLFGIPRSYYGYKTGRSSKKTQMFYEWPSEIAKLIPIYRGSVKEIYEENLALINKWKEELENENKQKALAQEQKQKEQKNIYELAQIKVKYGIPAEYDEDSVMDTLLDKNKYLNLAYAMEKTRGDWTDGYYRVESAIDEFVPEQDNEIDKEIMAEILDLCGSEDIDGRCFRDCDYNYNVLYGMVPQDLLDDFKKVYNMLESGY